MRLHELVEFLEETYGMIIESEALTGSNLDSIDSISGFIQHRLNANTKDGASADGGQTVEVGQ